MKKFDINSLKERFKRLKDKNTPLSAHTKFEKEVLLSYQLVHETSKIPETEIECKNLFRISKENLIVNLISQLEIYLKGIIVENSNWNEEGYSFLLKEYKISLDDAFSTFSKHSVTREFIIASQFSLQSIENIDSVFSKLTEICFLLRHPKF